MSFGETESSMSLALEGRLSTSFQSPWSTDPGLIAGTWHRPLFLTRDRWFESGSLQRRVRLSPGAAFAGREPRLSARLCAAGLTTGSAETRRVLQDHANRRQYLCRAIFQYRNAADGVGREC